MLYFICPPCFPFCFGSVFAWSAQGATACNFWLISSFYQTFILMGIGIVIGVGGLYPLVGLSILEVLFCMFV